ncbi:hypothetical protein BDV25DRAFT_138877 [Aspergillus avenaceus]|uniref:FAD-binding domain-containing protein n=1 Tax=Aspergillus avenaceus TaxID=36643 RepID=A0A5N6TYK6_ASPAV|nr:hypothetical protein BDV25DRAFT_138877 [Aspergillus avenaceus]
MSDFTVLIVGGSIAGLTLANILELYNINYVVLEKYPTLPSQFGAGIAIWPHSMFVLDQIGMSEKLESISCIVEALEHFGPGGVPLHSPLHFGRLVEDLSGYPPMFFDRCELIQALYDNLKDKAKIHMSKEVVTVKDSDPLVRVTTKDGSVFTGDVVVGADGVHSQTRAEMWATADAEGVGYAIVCTYKCLGGVAHHPNRTANSYAQKTSYKNHSYLTQPGKRGNWYLFILVRNSQKTVGCSIPKYTTEDKLAVLEEYGNDLIIKGMSLNDVHRTFSASFLVPLEEYLFKRCFYKRCILIGDSFHKASILNPTTGQGANLAIEEAAILADSFKTLLESKTQLDRQRIEAVFSSFEWTQRARVEVLISDAHNIQRLEALENPILEFIQMQMAKRLDLTLISVAFTAALCPGHILEHLPRPLRSGIVALDQDVLAQPQRRSRAATNLWILSMTLLFGLSIIHSFPSQKPILISDNALGAYTFALNISINAIWTVESFRPGSSVSLLVSAYPYVIASTVLGWEFVFPIYAICYISQSRKREFYYPNPRAIDLKAAERLPIALLIAYSLPAISIVIPHETRIRGTPITEGLAGAAHIAFPFLVSLAYTRLRKNAPNAEIIKSLYGVQDMPYLVKFYNVLIVGTTSCHIVHLYPVIRQLLRLGMAQNGSMWCGTSTPLMLSITILVWCVFTVWNLHRVNVSQTPVPVALIWILLGIIFLGPATTMVWIWKQREALLEKSRQRK